MEPAPSATNSAPPSPAGIFEALNSFHRSAALRTAIELDLFTALAAGPQTAAALAAACEAAERGMATLCDALTVYGFLVKNGDRYAATADAALFLNRNSPAYVGSAAFFLTSLTVQQAFGGLTAAVKKGGSALPDQGVVADSHPAWTEFARYMGPMMNMQARAIAACFLPENAPAMKILDVAAGHGMFGIAMALRNPKAQVYALDWPQVLTVARENATVAGVSERVHNLAGDAFTLPLGEDYDWVLLPNFLHHFDAATCVNFLRRTRAALKPGGRVAVLEFVPNDDRVSPPGAALFSLVMLVMTPAGNAYTFAELSDMLTQAGFQPPSAQPLPGGMQVLAIASR